MKKWIPFLLTLVFLPITNCYSVEYFPQTEEVEEYLNEMPWQYYRQYKVPGLGKFWVDNAKDVVKDTIKSGKIWETYIIDLIKNYAKPGDHVVDIGAHMGTITMAMANVVGPQGRVYSFEGERQFFRELVENIKLNKRDNIFPHLCWVCDEDSSVLTHTYYPEGYSPVHQTTDQPYTLLKRRLDSLDLGRVDLMKIDVECTEDSVLDGAYETIMANRPVMIIEIMGGFGYMPSAETQRRIQHTISKLNAMDYDVSLIWVDDYLAIPREKKTNHAIPREKRTNH